MLFTDDGVLLPQCDGDEARELWRCLLDAARATVLVRAGADDADGAALPAAPDE